jgi:hypothetical protein
MKTVLKPTLIATLLLLSTIESVKAAPFVTNGPLVTARYYQRATLLPNGKVLVAGDTD